MSQSTLIPVYQWDPIQIFTIDQKRDGNFTCSGVNKGTDVRCGWNIKKEAASNINDLVEELSIRPPQSAVQYLNTLADACLCRHHKTQKMIVVKEWSAAISRLPTSTPMSTASGKPILTPESTPPPPSPQPATHKGSRQRFPPQPKDNGIPTLKPSDGTSTDEIHLLKGHIDALLGKVDDLTARMADLETNLRKKWYTRK